MSLLLVEREGPLKRVRLNRPDKRNALSLALATELLQEVERSHADGTRLLVLRGEGAGFCAGFDLSAFPDCSDGDLLLHFVRIEQLLQAVAHAPFDTLACVHGATIGAGADLAVACRHRVGAGDTTMLFPGARFGLVLGSRRLAECVGAERAQTLIGGQQRLDATRARDLRLLQELAEPDQWPALEARLLQHALATPADTRAAVLHAARRDTRAQDLHDLVLSAAHPELRQRLTAYLAQQRAASPRN